MVIPRERLLGKATAHRADLKLVSTFDSARKYGTVAHLWASYPQQITAFCQRMHGVVVENKPALEVLKNHDRDSTLFYMDPPYKFETRKMGSNKKYYQHEMTDQDHEELLLEVEKLKGFVILSGYDNKQYNDLLPGWEKRMTKARISAGRGTGIRTECVWLNKKCSKH